MTVPESETSGSLLSCRVVYGRYEGFIPFYVFCFLRAYPEHFVRVVLATRLGEKARRAMDIVGERLSERFEIVENVRPEMEKPGHDGMAFRWLIGQEHFAGFDYGMLGDVDILIVREERPLLDVEIARARELDQPYVNVVRDSPGHRNEMGGCSHFLIVKPYFDAMQPLIDEALADPRILVTPPRPGADEEWRNYNEHLLYLLVKRGLGVLEADEPRPFSWNMLHGFHLGIARVNRSFPAWYRKNKTWREEGRSILADPRFIAIRALTAPWILRQIDALNQFLAE